MLHLLSDSEIVRDLNQGRDTKVCIPAGSKTFQEELKQGEDYMVAVIRTHLRDI